MSGKDGRSPWGLASENQRMFQGAERGDEDRGGGGRGEGGQEVVTEALGVKGPGQESRLRGAEVPASSWELLHQ